MRQYCWLLIMLLMCATPVWADGMLVPVRPEVPAFSVSYHRVNVTIDRQVATTEVDQAFHNHTGRQVEGTYIFPILDGMSISKFSMYAGNEELTHRILEKEEARRIYNGIVNRRQDPALLEWLGSRMIQARVFPIEPNEDKRIQLAYQEVLSAQGGVVKYVYPLKTEKMSATPLKECAVTINIRSKEPIRTIYSPTHAVTVDRNGEYAATVTYKAQSVLPDQDLVLYYTTSPEKLGVDMLTYREKRQGDGFFLLLAAPQVNVKDTDIQPKDVVFVFDTSGSMQGEKIEQAKAALKFCVNSLDRRDRFNVVTFSSGIEPWHDELHPASPANLREATEFIAERRATGGTNINGAIDTALQHLKAGSEEGRPAVVIFMTDGLPTVGETRVEKILANVNAWNTRKVRLFNFGVGSDYNAHFLDMLANDHNGYTENVLPREDIEVKVSDFYAKVSTPLLMDMRIDWGGAQVYDQYPNKLPDLFKGSQLVLTGRYKPRPGQEDTTVTLSGEIAGKRQTFKYRLLFPNSSYDDDSIPRLWATRKIGYLEDQLRLHGVNKEVLEELIALSKTYGILSQYTAFLVDMDVTAPVGAAGPRAKAFRPNAELARDAYAPITNERNVVVGNSAVRQSMNTKRASNAVQVASPGVNVVLNDAGEEVRLTQLRNVSQRSFVQNGTEWVDINFTAAQKVIKVRAFSPAYFQLANAHPNMAQYMSMGKNVTVAVKDVAVQIGPEGQETEFAAKDFEGLREKMNHEFGVPAATAASVPIAMIPAMPTARAPMPLLTLALVLPVMAGVRARQRTRRG